MENNKRIGMLGALMDEYERAAIDLKKLLAGINQESFQILRDSKTKDPDCKSIKTVVTHVIQSGYTYANYINSVFSDNWEEYEQTVENSSTAIAELDKMLTFTNQKLLDKYDLPMKTIESWSFKTRWGVTYDIEQLLEHAIVHILRHRRQIERFLEL